MSAEPVGVIGGSGNDELPELRDAKKRQIATVHGTVEVTTGTVRGRAVVHVSRHGHRHERLSNHVQHRANIAALVECGATAVIGLTVCGAVDPDLRPGSLVVFDDLHFPSNRLPDGTLCTWYESAGHPRRSHWVFDRPFSEDLRATLLAAAPEAGVPFAGSGTYGHVDGPRFNTRSEIAQLRTAGVAAVSQTGGPETVLSGEVRLPYALLGYVTDFANGVVEEPEPVAALLGRMAHSKQVFSAVLASALPNVHRPEPSGVIVEMS
ncbi:5'-methylthioadenosine phosphorylase [Actinopolymorpha cephalotaxi]|uniref:5'-methylthioadenosine phosphorylase n=1 Tax=Actinopolymorpha cephalotaxi TaxID=504797 RepID=A0A1I3C9E8_9ACTN|nr:MTAP family purine nucleoside phosphorylase [Actinopolymorpha cephalotaxi]NYH86855.1 5'-methylthioadenosine phosphorylase [Actinopolymorpha cephalotaxi]SFH70799.1 5'-methylthioadenosine phosphorylase [Actinopolymorpha cephalotaxi]